MHAKDTPLHSPQLATFCPIRLHFKFSLLRLVFYFLWLKAGEGKDLPRPSIAASSTPKHSRTILQRFQWCCSCSIWTSISACQGPVKLFPLLQRRCFLVTSSSYCFLATKADLMTSTLWRCDTPTTRNQFTIPWQKTGFSVGFFFSPLFFFECVLPYG